VQRPFCYVELEDRKASDSSDIPIALQISALTHGGAGVFGKGFDSRDAVTEPCMINLNEF
jgi:hypothetical protein